MDFSHRYVSATAVAGLLLACVSACGDQGSSSSSDSEIEDERGSIGVPPSAVDYCTRLGFTIVENRCRFLDGTSCDQWAFFQGECGQEHSYCHQHGGTVSTKTEDMGTWTAVYGVCDVDGRTCKEASFMQTGKCE